MCRSKRKVVLALVLSLVTSVASVVSVGAETTSTATILSGEDPSSNCTVTYNVPSSYSVTVPSAITLTGVEQTIVITSDNINIPSDKQVAVYIDGTAGERGAEYQATTGILKLARLAGELDTVSGKFQFSGADVNTSFTPIARFQDSATPLVNLEAGNLKLSAVDTGGVALAGDYAGAVTYRMACENK